MDSTLLEPVLELLTVAAYAAGTAVLTVFGVLIEQFGVQTLAAGEPFHAAWLLFMGAMALFFGPYGLGYRRFLPSARRLLARLG
jgi:hypothetical protein